MNRFFVFPALGPIRVAVAMIGKFAITASFANIYVHTAEIYPTPLRYVTILIYIFAYSAVS